MSFMRQAYVQTANIVLVTKVVGFSIVYRLTFNTELEFHFIEIATGNGIINYVDNPAN